MVILFFICFFLIIYTYIGYGIVLAGLVFLKRLFWGKKEHPSIADSDWPEITFVVAAYNEEGWIEDKVRNGLAFDYPKDKIHHLFVTDGSNDRTPDLIRQYSFPTDVAWSVHHKDARRGKIAAVERIMAFVKTPIVIYTDANTMVNAQAIKNIVRHYEDERVGAVAGEKRISMDDKDAANAAGEGIYWKYESTLKKWDSELNTVVGAAGELFSMRTVLYEPVSSDMVIEDFYMTLRIAQKGYKVAYEPGAYAVESSSASVGEELKRKIRIAAGGLQAIVRLSPLLNIFKYGLLSFQYISHRVLRWTLTPLALFLLFFINIAIVATDGHWFYQYFLIAQVAFYILALIGYWLETRKLKFKAFFIPYYFCVMNYAVYRGFFRYWKGSQSVIWEKAKRADA